LDTGKLTNVYLELLLYIHFSLKILNTKFHADIAFSRARFNPCRPCKDTGKSPSDPALRYIRIVYYLIPNEAAKMSAYSHICGFGLDSCER
jgi:hypothetical protein